MEALLSVELDDNPSWTIKFDPRAFC